MIKKFLTNLKNFLLPPGSKKFLCSDQHTGSSCGVLRAKNPASPYGAGLAGNTGQLVAGCCVPRVSWAAQCNMPRRYLVDLVIDPNVRSDRLNYSRSERFRECPPCLTITQKAANVRL